MKKRRLFPFALMMAGVALCTPAMSGEDGPLQMIVERHMGVKTSIPVADIHKITFGQGAMHIDYQNNPQSGMPQEIALSEIKKWWFSPEVLSA